MCRDKKKKGTHLYSFTVTSFWDRPRGEERQSQIYVFTRAFKQLLQIRPGVAGVGVIKVTDPADELDIVLPFHISMIRRHGLHLPSGESQLKTDFIVLENSESASHRVGRILVLVAEASPIIDRYGDGVRIRKGGVLPPTEGQWSI